MILTNWIVGHRLSDHPMKSGAWRWNGKYLHQSVAGVNQFLKAERKVFRIWSILPRIAIVHVHQAFKT